MVGLIVSPYTAIEAEAKELEKDIESVFDVPELQKHRVSGFDLCLLRDLDFSPHMMPS